jgi:hypothetical protein
MYQGQTIFYQLVEFLPQHAFRKCVNRYQGNYRKRSFSCYDQFLCMAFAQLTFSESLRDIECCLRAMEEKLYHPGFLDDAHSGNGSSFSNISATVNVIEQKLKLFLDTIQVEE